jgi:hypothetical protein
MFAKPVGNGNYVVRTGDCLESIAFQRGLLWQSIWDHPRNGELKQAGRTPNVLLPGDQLYIPERVRKVTSATTDKVHKFCLKNVPSKIQIRIVRWVQSSNQSSSQQGTSQPRANIPYILVIDGKTTRGQTDNDGMVIQSISPGARQGKLILESGSPNACEIELDLGALDPVDSATGVCQRLANLGFAYANDHEPGSPEFKDAVTAFQVTNGIQATGQLDSDTSSQLNSVHRS